LARRRRLQVAVLYPESSLPDSYRDETTSVDPVAPEDHGARGDEAKTCGWSGDAYGHMLRALEAEGCEVQQVGIGFATLGRIDDLEVDVAVNLCDGCTLDGEPGVEVLDALEARGIPYTGARRLAYWIGSDKVRMKVHFLNAGVPTPRFQVMGDAEEALDPRLTFPLFVKPCDTAGSVGVGLDSRVDDERHLRARLAKVIPLYGPALVEEYVDGRELSVGIIGDGDDLTIFPPVEVRFGPAYPSDRRVQTFESKFDPSSPLYGGYELCCPARLGEDEERTVIRAARDAYQAIGGTGYGRVDLRIGAGGPRVLEVNPNCSLEWVEGSVKDSCMFPAAAKAAGWTLRDVYRRLIDVALARNPVPSRMPVAAPLRTRTH
jgi:D-alanine-D-alanine ligase